MVVTVNGKESIELPEIWQELTVHQYQQMATDWDNKDLIKLFSILSGIEYKALENTHDPKLEDALIISTRFIYDQDFKFSTDLPEDIKIGDKFLVIPQNLRSLSVGQNIHVRQRMETSKVYEELISFVTAIYLQPLYDESDFDFHSAMELEQTILKMPAYEIYPIGVFFLNKLKKSGRSSLSGLNLLKTLFRKDYTKKEKELQNRRKSGNSHRLRT